MTTGHQVRRAWIVLSLASVVFLIFTAGIAATARFVYVHATQAHPASVEIVSGSAALYRRQGESNWLLIEEETQLQEGDEISTALGTVLRINLFDGSFIEVSEDTLIRIDRARSSRFLNRTKAFTVSLQDGTIYVHMTPHREFGYAEFEIDAHGVNVTMSTEPGREEAGVFLAEVLSEARTDDRSPPIRVAALSGATIVETSADRRKIISGEQVIASSFEGIGEPTTPFRQFVANGDFQNGLSNWSEYRRSSIPGADPTGAQSSIVNVRTDAGSFTALRFHRPDGFNVPVTMGVRQRIGQTVRNPDSLELRMDVRVDSQNPPVSDESADMFPVAFTLHYVDNDGEDRELTRGYYIAVDGTSPVPQIRGSAIPEGKWQRIVFNLNDLTPQPRQIDSILVYASGVSFEASVANISLTTREEMLE